MVEVRVSAPERVAQARPLWKFLSVEEKHALAWKWADTRVRMLVPAFERGKRDDWAGAIEALPPLRDIGTLLRASAVIQVIFKSKPSPYLRDLVLSTLTFLKQHERGIDLDAVALGLVMASRRHFGDDRFFDSLTSSLNAER